MSGLPLPAHLAVPTFERFGVRAFVTTRAAGDFNLGGDVPGAVDRWHALHRALAEAGAPRLASATQVHGTRVLVHEHRWECVHYFGRYNTLSRSLL